MISKELRAELKEAWEKSTQGEWRWYNGCSWWRLGLAHDPAKHDAVLRPYICKDGHPDIACSDADREFTCLAHNSMSSLLETIEELERERDCGGRDSMTDTPNAERWLRDKESFRQQKPELYAAWNAFYKPLGMNQPWLEFAEFFASSVTKELERERDEAEKRGYREGLEQGIVDGQLDRQRAESAESRATQAEAERDRMKEEVERLKSENEMLRSQLDMRGCIRKLGLKGDGK